MQSKNTRLELRKSSPVRDLSVGNHGRHSFDTELARCQRNKVQARTREHQRLKSMHWNQESKLLPHTATPKWRNTGA